MQTRPVRHGQASSSSCTAAVAWARANHTAIRQATTRPHVHGQAAVAASYVQHFVLASDGGANQAAERLVAVKPLKVLVQLLVPLVPIVLFLKMMHE